MEQVTRALGRHRKAEQQLEHTRGELHAAIADALRAGIRQADLVKATGYTREHVRRIAREAGIEA